MLHRECGEVDADVRGMYDAATAETTRVSQRANYRRAQFRTNPCAIDVGAQNAYRFRLEGSIIDLVFLL
jgi:hypothetical protein